MTTFTTDPAQSSLTPITRLRKFLGRLKWPTAPSRPDTLFRPLIKDSTDIATALHNRANGA